MAKDKKDKKQDEAEEGAKKKGGLVALLVPILVLALLGAGAGYGFGTFVLTPKIQTAEAEKAAAAEAALAEAEEAGHGEEADHAAGGEGEDGHGEAVAGVDRIVDLEPILTSLAAPETTWLRAELSLSVAGDVEQKTIDEIGQDYLNFLRTLSLDQLAGQSSFLTIRSGLLRRAKTRAGDDKVHAIYVRTLIYE